jgi:hypothetical protein
MKINKVLLILCVSWVLYGTLRVLFFRWLEQAPAPRPGLLLSAYREGQLGGMWVGLYADQHYEVRSSVNGHISRQGLYTLTSDTLKLLDMQRRPKLQYLVDPPLLWMIPKFSGSSFLEIQVNQLPKGSPPNKERL